MEQICERANMNQAYRKVKANKGAAGVDVISIERLPVHIREHKEEFLVELLAGSYKPEL
jgi:RNA-directed DNA polymerase